MNQTQASALNRTAEEAFTTFVKTLFSPDQKNKVPYLNNIPYRFHRVELARLAGRIFIDRWRQRGWLVEAGKDGRRMVLEIPDYIVVQIQKLFAGEPLNLPRAEPDISQN